MKKLASFSEIEGSEQADEQEDESPAEAPDAQGAGASATPDQHHVSKLGLSYNINLILPNTDDPKVFNAIFKSLKENLL